LHEAVEREAGSSLKGVVGTAAGSLDKIAVVVTAGAERSGGGGVLGFELMGCARALLQAIAANNMKNTDLH